MLERNTIGKLTNERNLFHSLTQASYFIHNISEIRQLSLDNELIVQSNDYYFTKKNFLYICTDFSCVCLFQAQTNFPICEMFQTAKPSFCVDVVDLLVRFKLIQLTSVINNKSSLILEINSLIYTLVSASRDFSKILGNSNFQMSHILCTIISFNCSPMHFKCMELI